MKFSKLAIFIILLVLSAAIFGCKPSVLDRETIIENDFPIVTIDTTMQIMASDLYFRLADSDLLEEGGYIDSSIYMDTLKAIVLDSIISKEARDIKLKDDYLGLYYTYFLRFTEFYMTYLFQKMVLDSITIDSASADSFFRANQDMFEIKEQVKAKHIVISAKGLKEGKDSLVFEDYSMEQLDSIAKAKIYELKAKVDSGTDFGYLASEYSMHSQSARHDGSLGFFFRKTYNDEFEEVAFNLSVGEVSEPFKSPDGWHLILVEERIEEGVPEYGPEQEEKAKVELSKIESYKLSKALIDSLDREAEIIYNDSALMENPYEVPDTTWAAIVNEVDTIDFYRMGDYYHQISSMIGFKEPTLEDKKNMLKTRARTFLLMQTGEDLGYSDDSAVVENREKLYHKYAMDAFKLGASDPDWRPSDSLIEDYYGRNIDKFIIERPLNVQHIIVEDSAFGEFLRDQALSGIDFLDLAEQHYPGTEEIRRAAADLGWIGPGEMPVEFYEAAKNTNANDISHPVKTDWGYHIIKVLDKKYNKTIEQATPEIFEILVAKHKKDFRNEWKRQLFNKHDIEYHLENLKRVELASKNRR